MKYLGILDTIKYYTIGRNTHISFLRDVLPCCPQSPKASTAAWLSQTCFPRKVLLLSSNGAGRGDRPGGRSRDEDRPGCPAPDTATHAQSRRGRVNSHVPCTTDGTRGKL